MAIVFQVEIDQDRKLPGLTAYRHDLPMILSMRASLA